MQRLLRHARWDADAVRDDLRAFAVEHLGTDGGVLIVDETGFVKKGHASAGVQRQYTGTAGRIENSQVGVFLHYATSRGRTLIDRWPYLPENSWCTDPERRQAAGIPDEIATKPRPAWDVIAAALDAGGGGIGECSATKPAGRIHSYVPAWRSPASATFSRSPARHRCGSTQAAPPSARTPFACRLPATAWQRQSAGPGAKGPRYNDWAWIHSGTGEHRHLLIHRNRTSGALAFHLCRSPTTVTLAELVRVAGARWSVEECFQAAKGQIGLDSYQVRLGTSWHRHITLAMLALAFLTDNPATAPTALIRCC
ncbi:IS701 family transposase [Streptomyces spongiicola]